MTTPITVKDNLQVKVRWATPEDASAIARVELSSSRFENRAHPHFGLIV